MKMLRLYSEEDLARCPLDKWGILDPGTHRREPGKEAELREDGALQSACADIDSLKADVQYLMIPSRHWI
jgi:5-formyltetrahydrofolate cyclo-ligase